MNDQVLAAVTVATPGPEHYTRANELQAQATALVVLNPPQYLNAADLLKSLKGRAGAIEDERKKLKAPILQAGRAVDDFFGRPLAVLAEAEKIIKHKLVVYDQAQEKLRREEQAKAEEKARKERETLEDKARAAIASGRLERANELEQRAAAVVAPVIDRAPPKVAGVTFREVWNFEIVDAQAIPRQYLSVNESAIGKVVKALKADTLIPGIRVFPTKEIAAGSA